MQWHTPIFPWTHRHRYIWLPLKPTSVICKGLFPLLEPDNSPGYQSTFFMVEGKYTRGFDLGLLALLTPEPIPEEIIHKIWVGYIPRLRNYCIKTSLIALVSPRIFNRYLISDNSSASGCDLYLCGYTFLGRVPYVRVGSVFLHVRFLNDSNGKKNNYCLSFSV